VSTYTKAADWCASLGGIKYIVTDALSWELGFVGSGLFITVPTGRTFDVSVPSGVRWLFDPHNPKYLKAAALHDELLSVGWDRITAGAVFHEALKADTVTVWRRLAMWLTVSLFKY
tara:strand:- start:2243 stop:2590 length:348 start_codon:yes stop_codon:yes gene_type:complete